MSVEEGDMHKLRNWMSIFSALMLLNGCSQLAPQLRSESAPWPLAKSAPMGGPATTGSTDIVELHPVKSSPMPILLQSRSMSDVSSRETARLYRDAWDRMRLGFAIPELNSPLVDSYARRFAAKGSLHGLTGERLRLYLHFLLDEIEVRGMPTELALLPIVESSLNPQARSLVGAAGAWQFMPATGKRFDMRQSRLVDDRKSLLASTRGALTYLQELHARFGDWHLALAAYNWGEGSVARAQAKNRAAGRPADYLSLNMPKETRNYVPQLNALKHLVRDPESFGIQLPHVRNESYFRQVALKRDIDFTLALRLADISEKEFLALNAAVTRPLIMASATPELLLPLEAADRFSKGLETYDGPTATWTAIRIQKGQHIDRIASDLRVNAVVLRKVNGIPVGKKPVPGSTLFVPTTKVKGPVTSSTVESAYLQLSPDLVKSEIRAKKGETLSALARRFHFAPEELARWNRLSSKARLKAGQRITIYRIRMTNANEAGVTLDKSIGTATPREKEGNRSWVCV